MFRDSEIKKFLFIILSFVLASLFFMGSSKAVDEALPRLTFENVIGKFEQEIEKADYYYQVLDWNANLHSDDNGLAEMLTIYEQKLQDLINDEENFKRIKALRDEYEKNNAKGEKRKLVEKWYKFLDKRIVLDPRTRDIQKEEIKLKNDLTKIWNSFRPQMKDKEGRYILDEKTGKPKIFNSTELRRILSQSKDREERKRAYEASTLIGFEMKKNGFRDLVKIRNKFAQARGYKDFFHMKCAYADFDAADMFKIFDKLLEGTDSVTRKAIYEFKKENNLSNFEPWDLTYASTGFSYLIDPYLPKDGVDDVLKATFKGIGIDIEKSNIKMDLEPRINKYPHAAAWYVKHSEFKDGKWSGEDIRLMANLDKGGIDQYANLFHEAGHAVHAANIRQKSVIDRRFGLHNDLRSFRESVAIFFEKMIEEENWFANYADFIKNKNVKRDENKYKEIFLKYKAKTMPWKALIMRGMLTPVYFEREIYNNPDTDFEKTWWELANKISLVEMHTEYPSWGRYVHFLIIPAEYQAYIIADLISEQVRHYFKEKYGQIVDNHKIGGELSNKILNLGASRTWAEMLKNLTGESLNPIYAIEAATKF